MGKILKNSIEYASTFLGRFKGKIISETPPTDAYDWDVDSDPPATTQYYTGFEIQDSQQNRLSNIDCHADANGSVKTVIGARKSIDGQTTQNQIYIGVDGNGNRYYGLDDSGAFRYALGIGDHITEVKTSGIWTYRKWSSGIAECWGTYTNTTSQYATPLGGYAYTSSTVNFPSGLFISPPVCTYSARVGNGMALTGTSTSNLTKDSNTYYALAQVSGSQTCYWYIHATGLWKQLGS